MRIMRFIDAMLGIDTRPKSEGKAPTPPPPRTHPEGQPVHPTNPSRAERIGRLKDRLRQIAAAHPGIPLYKLNRDTRQEVEALGNALHALEEGIHGKPLGTEHIWMIILAAQGEYERGEEPHREWDRAMLEDDVLHPGIRQVLDRLAKLATPPGTPPPQPSPITIWTRQGTNGMEGTVDGVHWFPISEKTLAFFAHGGPNF